MPEHDVRVKGIEKLVRRGYVRHDKIEPQLEKMGLTGMITPDDISTLVRKYKYGKAGWTGGKVGTWLKVVLDKIGSYVLAIVVAALIAESIASRQFAGSLLGDRLQGFGSHLMFWLGLKKVEISGPDMAQAMTKVGLATPHIIKGIVIGLIVGYLGWKAGTRIVGYLFKRSRRRKDIKTLLTEQNQPSAQPENAESLPQDAV